MARGALLVGIDGYAEQPLRGCVKDANRMAELLDRHENGDPNFETIIRTVRKDSGGKLTTSDLEKAIKTVFHGASDTALFYFSGHGIMTPGGAYLQTTDSAEGNPGIAMDWIINIANNARAAQKIIIMDCCHSGGLGNAPGAGRNISNISEGVTVLTASREDEPALEIGEGGVFTGLVVDALAGGAADVLGNISTSSVYSYVDEALGAFDQRPLYKTNLSRSTSLRKCKPRVAIEILRKIPQYFPKMDAEHKLTPAYEPDEDPKNLELEEIFAHLQKLNRVGLVEPVEADHMYYAAIENKSCQLTPRGQQYWRLAVKGKI